jgi:hypothetical protein
MLPTQRSPHYILTGGAIPPVLPSRRADPMLRATPRTVILRIPYHAVTCAPQETVILSLGRRISASAWRLKATTVLERVKFLSSTAKHLCRSCLTTTVDKAGVKLIRRAQFPNRRSHPLSHPHEVRPSTPVAPLRRVARPSETA